MLKCVVNRLFFAIPAVVLVVSVVFLLIRVIPGDPIAALLGDQATDLDREKMMAALGLDQPWWGQLVWAWRGYLSGDWGTSLVYNKPILSMILERMGPTLLLGLSAMGVAVILGLVSGILVAKRGQQLHSKGIETHWKGVLMGVVAVPSLVLGPLLLLVFSIWLGWLPLGGNGGGWVSLILPSLTLGLGMGAALGGLLAESIGEELGRDYVRTVTAKGGDAVRAWGHVLMNSLIPFTILMCLQMGVVLTGVVLTEVVFGWPGVGSLLVEGLQTRDYPLVQGVMIVIAVGYVLANTLADLLVGVLDQRAAGGER